MSQATLRITEAYVCYVIESLDGVQTKITIEPCSIVMDKQDLSAEIEIVISNFKEIKQFNSGDGLDTEEMNELKELYKGDN